MSRVAKKNTGYLYDNYDDSYYRYKEHKDKIRERYPQTMSRGEWQAYHKEVMDLIETSADWQQWVWDNPVPYIGRWEQEQSKRKMMRNRKKRPKAIRRSSKDYPTFVAFKNGVLIEGKEWNDIRTAEHELGTPAGSVSGILNGHRKQTKEGISFKWKKDLENA